MCTTGFTNLRELRLDGCEGASTLASLAELRGLTALSLQRCAAICGLRHLAGAPCAFLGNVVHFTSAVQVCTPQQSAASKFVRLQYTDEVLEP